MLDVLTPKQNREAEEKGGQWVQASKVEKRSALQTTDVNHHSVDRGKRSLKPAPHVHQGFIAYVTHREFGPHQGTQIKIDIPDYDDMARKELRAHGYDPDEKQDVSGHVWLGGMSHVPTKNKKTNLEIYKYKLSLLEVSEIWHVSSMLSDMPYDLKTRLDSRVERGIEKSRKLILRNFESAGILPTDPLEVSSSLEEEKGWITVASKEKKKAFLFAFSSSGKHSLTPISYHRLRDGHYDFKPHGKTSGEWIANNFPKLLFDRDAIEQLARNRTGLTSAEVARWIANVLKHLNQFLKIRPG
jgi:hypothetical protein